ncbi:MAG: hypothetical protein OXG25_05915 [Gammaproteobacteria bacterium]|nr:hypothetical protein [Gammaproteobacteria bacterium]
MKSVNQSASDKFRREQEIAHALAAMRKAAKDAHKRAAQCGHKIPVSQDGKVVWIDPITDL